MKRLEPAVLGRIAQASVAAGLAWELARRIPGHTRPFFAPIAAVIALGAEPGRRSRQATEVILGVALGIVLGAALVAVAGIGGWQIVVGVALALVVGTALDVRPLVRTQAAASVVLVVALHQPGKNVGLQRLEDALVGGAIAIVLARLLFPADPLELVARAEGRLRSQLVDVLDEIVAALESRDAGAMQSALAHVDALDDRDLVDALVLARLVTQRAPRRRRVRGAVEELSDDARQLTAATADVRTLATGGLRMLRQREEPSADLLAAARAVADAWRADDPVVARELAGQATERARAIVGGGASIGGHASAYAIDSLAGDVQRSVRRA